VKVETPELVAVQALPAVLSGIPEAQTYLRLPDDFLRTWLEIGSDLVPAIPHFRLGQKVCFPTAAVLEWLATYHGYGGTMRHPSLRPKTKRKQPRRKEVPA
jgi:hypothetical protein